MESPQSEQRPPSVERILGEVSRHTGISVLDIKSARRDIPTVEARQLAMYLCRTLTLNSLPAIGRLLRRDHTSVLHGYKKYRHLREINPVIDAHISGLVISLTEPAHAG